MLRFTVNPTSLLPLSKNHILAAIFFFFFFCLHLFPRELLRLVLSPRVQNSCIGCVKQSSALVRWEQKRDTVQLDIKGDKIVSDAIFLKCYVAIYVKSWILSVAISFLKATETFCALLTLPYEWNAHQTGAVASLTRRPFINNSATPAVLMSPSEKVKCMKVNEVCAVSRSEEGKQKKGKSSSS